MVKRRNVAVRRDNRTLEQKRHDSLNNLERHYSPGETSNRQLAHPESWTREVIDWIAESRRHMEEDMRFMRERVCPLLPLNGFGVDPWGSPLQTFEAIAGSPPTMVNYMDEQMGEMQQQMSSTIATATNDEGDTHMQPNLFSTHDSLTGCRAMDVLKDNYQIGDDGHVHMSVNFCTKDFAPEDINVTTSANRLIVQANKTVKTDNSSNIRQFYRRIDLPDSIDHDNMKCHLSNDGVLSVDVPVKTPDYSSLTFDEGRRLAIKPKPQSPAGQLTKLGKAGVTVMKDNTGGQKIHVEVALEAGFTADDMLVRVDEKQLVVSGKLNRVAGTRKEFTHTYDIPETVDPMAISASITDNVLVIEAPFVSAV